MRKDIEIDEVKDVAIAIVPHLNEHGEFDWTVYFMNLKPVPVTSVLINAEARGTIDGEMRKTATMRFYMEEVAAMSAKKFELLMPDTFVLDNQYWVSFYENGKIFEKKFLFSANTITLASAVSIPLLETQGLIQR